MPLLADITWPEVVLTVTPTAASVASAYIAYLVRRDVKTSNGSTLGQIAEQARDTAADNGTMIAEMHSELVGGKDT